jgi:hypothetical protein
MRMTEQEYLDRLENLQSIVADETAGGEPGGALSSRYAALEFDLAIDYRLGRNFPRERRRMLHAIRERFDNERSRLVHLLSAGRVDEDAFRQRLQVLVDAMAARYADVLMPQEYGEFIGPATGIIARSGEELG